MSKLDECMEILEWFGDSRYEYARQIWLTKADADERLSGVLPAMRKHAQSLVRAHRGMEDAYPEAVTAA